jgi:hypothetical protein
MKNLKENVLFYGYLLSKQPEYKDTLNSNRTVRSWKE